MTAEYNIFQMHWNVHEDTQSGLQYKIQYFKKLLKSGKG